MKIHKMGTFASERILYNWLEFMGLGHGVHSTMEDEAYHGVGSMAIMLDCIITCN